MGLIAYWSLCLLCSAAAAAVIGLTMCDESERVETLLTQVFPLIYRHDTVIFWGSSGYNTHTPQVSG